MIMRTKHKTVLSLCRLIFDSPLAHFFFLLQHHHLQYYTRKNERERSLNYGRCLQWYAKFEKKNFCKKIETTFKKVRISNIYIYLWHVKSQALFKEYLKKEEMIHWNIHNCCCLLKVFLIEVKKQKR
jgi:hypothetical protein